jgi:hypothetical protein
VQPGQGGDACGRVQGPAREDWLARGHVRIDTLHPWTHAAGTRIMRYVICEEACYWYALRTLLSYILPGHVDTRSC